MAESHFKFLEDSVLRAKLVEIRSLFDSVTRHNLLPHFTDHSTRHTDKVAEYVAQLIEPIQLSAGKLTQEELYILYSACYLHDVGLSHEKPYVLRGFEEVTIELWEQLSSDEKRDYIRKNHAKISASLVGYGDQFKSVPHRELIAALCEAHTVWLPEEQARYDSLTPNKPERLHLLAGLLRIADLLDEDSSRANEVSSDWLDLPLESQVHWWRHRCVQKIVLSPSNRTGTIYYQYSPGQESAHETIKLLHFEELMKEYRRHETAFAPHNLLWVFQDEILKPPYSDFPEIPVEVLSRMKELAELATVQIEPDTSWKWEQEDNSVLQDQWQKAKLGTPHEQAIKYLKIANHYRMNQQLWREQHALAIASNILEGNITLEVISIAIEVTARSAIIYGRIGSPIFGLRKIAIFQSEQQALLDNSNIAPLIAAEIYGLLTLYEFDAALQKMFTLSSIAPSSAKSSMWLIGWASLLMCRPVNGLSGDSLIAAIVDSISTGNLSNDLSSDDCWDLSTLAYFADLSRDEERAKAFLNEALQKAETDEDIAELKWNSFRISRSQFGLPDSRDHAALNDLNDLSPRRGYIARRTWQAVRAGVKGGGEAALSRSWQLVFDAWQGLDWTTFETANEILSRELWKLKRAQCAWHAILSQDKEWCDTLASEVSVEDCFADADTFAEMSMQSRLPGHFPWAAKLLEAIAPQVSEEKTDNVLNFALHFVGHPCSLSSDDDRKRPAWKLVGRIAPFASTDAVASVIPFISEELNVDGQELAISEVFKAVRKLARKLSSSDALKVIDYINTWIQKAKAFGQDDAWDAIQALINQLQGPDRKAAEELLFPPGKSMRLLDSVLASLTALNVLLPTASINQVGAQVISQLPLWLQSLSPGQAIVEPDYQSFKMEQVVGDTRIFDSQPDPHLISAVVTLFPNFEDHVRELVVKEAVRQACNQTCSTSHRITMLSLLAQLPVGAIVGSQIALEPSLWISNVSESQIDLYNEAQNPLNPFKINMGDPFQICQWAFRAVVHHFGDQREIQTALETALASPDIRQRDAAVAGLYESTSISEQSALALSMLMMSSDNERSMKACRAVWKHAEHLPANSVLTIASAVSELSYGPLEHRRRAGELAQKLSVMLEGAALDLVKAVVVRLSNDGDIRVRRAIKASSS